MAMERYVRAGAFSWALRESGNPKKFPVTVTACSTAVPSAFASAFPSLAGKSLMRPAPVGILDIRLRSDRKVVVNGRQVEIPYGAKKFITVKALKKLAKAYAGSVMVIRRGNSWLRLRDYEPVAIPENGKQAELKSLPSFRLE
jgi:hypothetical protein